jgi:hypothetical protein
MDQRDFLLWFIAEKKDHAEHSRQLLSSNTTTILLFGSAQNHDQN